jgi:hypothetical protein
MLNNPSSAEKVIVPDLMFPKTFKYMIFMGGSLVWPIQLWYNIDEIHAPYRLTTSLLVHGIMVVALIYVIFGYGIMFYRSVIRPPRLVLSHAGITMVGSFGRKQFWAWSTLGPFRRGSRPFSIEAPRTDDPSELVYLPEWTVREGDKLFKVLNNYREALK